MQAKQRPALQQVLKQLVTLMRANKLANKVRWAVDVNPLEF
ncbi:MAG TPA: hypothetical protein PK571_03560 [Methylotenera sp.]|nr:hypothetical protein [Methylotenera sp.]